MSGEEGETLRKLLGGARQIVRRRGDHAPVREPRAEEAPPVILMCPECGFDYKVRRIDALAGGVTGYLWICECGTRYLPANGFHADLLSP